MLRIDVPSQILPTTGRRFLRVLGFALLQAAIFGSIVGALVYFRAPRAVLDPSGESTLTFRQRLAAPLVALERESLDWRARELGQHSPPLDSVLLASIDEETLANAREDAHPQVATRPWARELLGRMVGLMHDEGAKSVLLDLAFPDLSPRSSSKVDDDEAFRKLLDTSGVPTVLTFSVSAAAPPPMAHPLRPYLVRLGSSSEPLQVDALLQRALADRRPAFALAKGREKEVWVGVSSEEEGRAVARASGVKGAATVREFAAADRAYQVTAVDFLVHLAEVRVDGMDPDDLFQVKTITGPAAPLLGHGSAYGFSDLSPDSDGVVRGVLQLVRYVGPDGTSHVLPSAALAATLQRLG